MNLHHSASCGVTCIPGGSPCDICGGDVISSPPGGGVRVAAPALLAQPTLFILDISAIRLCTAHPSPFGPFRVVPVCPGARVLAATMLSWRRERPR